MKQIEKTRTLTDIYYEAYDGELFKSKEECEAYETNAKGVVGKKVFAFRVAKTSQYVLFSFASCCDDDIEIYLPKTASELDSLNQYLNFIDKDGKFLGEEYIGHHVIVQIGYDRDWYRADTYESLVNEFKEQFTKLITPKTEENANG